MRGPEGYPKLVPRDPESVIGGSFNIEKGDKDRERAINAIVLVFKPHVVNIFS